MMNTENDARVIQLAKEAGKFLTTGEREGDTGRKIIVSKDDAPEWFRDLCREAHGDFLPDDHRYEMISNALDNIAEADDDDDLDERSSEFADGDVDVYNAGRSRWLSSHMGRAHYVEEAAREYGTAKDGGGDFDLFAALGQGWYMEAEEVYHSVLGSLRAHAEELADEQEDDETETDADDDTE